MTQNSNVNFSLTANQANSQVLCHRCCFRIVSGLNSAIYEVLKGWYNCWVWNPKGEERREELLDPFEASVYGLQIGVL
jgi:hypothetical protein